MVESGAVGDDLVSVGVDSVFCTGFFFCSRRLRHYGRRPDGRLGRGLCRLGWPYMLEAHRHRTVALLSSTLWQVQLVSARGVSGLWWCRGPGKWQLRGLEMSVSYICWRDDVVFV